MKNPLRTAFVPGREPIGRGEYLLFTIFATGVLVLVAIVVMIVLSMVLTGAMGADRAEATLQASVPVVSLLLLMPASVHAGIVLGVRRLHDMGRTGWLMLPPYVGYAVALGAAMIPDGVHPLTGYVQTAGTTAFLAGIMALLVLPGRPAGDAEARPPRKPGRK